MSKGVDIKGEGNVPIQELIYRQFQFDDTHPVAGPSVAWKTDEGYRFIPLDDRTSIMRQYVEQRELFNTLEENKGLSDAVNKLLEEEIDQKGYLAFESESIFDIPPASTLKLNSKVRLIARFKLLQRHMHTPAPAPALPKKPVFEPKEDEIEMSMLRATAMQTLHLELFLASPDYPMDRFRDLLENVAEPWLSAGISNRELVDDQFEKPSDGPQPPMTEAERQEWYDDIRLEGNLTHEQLASWSYRLTEFPPHTHRKPTKLYTDWSSVNTKEEYEEMCSSVKERGVSAMFTRTWKLYQVDRIISARTIKEQESQQDSTDKGKGKEKEVSAQLEGLLSFDKAGEDSEFGEMKVELVTANLTKG
ncbi:uncharacterized protein F4822DRAFT_14104 [Hypoxylon trugodes]|uniref:uncharacterized protein n=1 Tax=Hypoxylon trugodes TaxID=326681 RepID=UPI00219C3F5A|nr:uncharacterized protein F4822DRAFT_14104 [Hypoxylon trugodes]KAI1393470.1 hypothetical protein F4822DRAFT_14104 [Hypoxylon trugodes]